MCPRRDRRRGGPARLGHESAPASRRSSAGLSASARPLPARVAGGPGRQDAAQFARGHPAASGLRRVVSPVQARRTVGQPGQPPSAGTHARRVPPPCGQRGGSRNMVFRGGRPRYGPGAPTKARRSAEITDEAHDTMLVVEAKRSVPWTKPEDVVARCDQPPRPAWVAIPATCFWRPLPTARFALCPPTCRANSCEPTPRKTVANPWKSTVDRGRDNAGDRQRGQDPSLVEAASRIDPLASKKSPRHLNFGGGDATEYGRRERVGGFSAADSAELAGSARRRTMVRERVAGPMTQFRLTRTLNPCQHQTNLSGFASG